MKEKKRRVGDDQKVSQNATTDATLSLSKADLDAVVKNAFEINSTIGIDTLEAYPKDVLREKALELQVRTILYGSTLNVFFYTGGLMVAEVDREPVSGNRSCTCIYRKEYVWK